MASRLARGAGSTRHVQVAILPILAPHHAPEDARVRHARLHHKLADRLPMLRQYLGRPHAAFSLNYSQFTANIKNRQTNPLNPRRIENHPLTAERVFFPTAEPSGEAWTGSRPIDPRIHLNSRRTR